jgi:hypothetical protein
VFGAGSPTAIAASSISDFIFSPAYGQPTAAQGPVNAAVALVLPERWLPPNYQVQINAVNIQAADQFSTVSWSAEFAEDVWDREADELATEQFLQLLAT